MPKVQTELRAYAAHLAGLTAEVILIERSRAEPISIALSAKFNSRFNFLTVHDAARFPDNVEPQRKPLMPPPPVPRRRRVRKAPPSEHRSPSPIRKKHRAPRTRQESTAAPVRQSARLQTRRVATRKRSQEPIIELQSNSPTVAQTRSTRARPALVKSIPKLVPRPEQPGNAPTGDHYSSPAPKPRRDTASSDDALFNTPPEHSNEVEDTGWESGSKSQTMGVVNPKTSSHAALANDATVDMEGIIGAEESPKNVHSQLSQPDIVPITPTSPIREPSSDHKSLDVPEDRVRTQPSVEADRCAANVSHLRDSINSFRSSQASLGREKRGSVAASAVAEDAGNMGDGIVKRKCVSSDNDSEQIIPPSDEERSTQQADQVCSLQPALQSAPEYRNPAMSENTEGKLPVNQDIVGAIISESSGDDDSPFIRRGKRRKRKAVNSLNDTDTTDINDKVTTAKKSDSSGLSLDDKRTASGRSNTPSSDKRLPSAESEVASRPDVDDLNKLEEQHIGHADQPADISMGLGGLQKLRGVPTASSKRRGQARKGSREKANDTSPDNENIPGESVAGSNTDKHDSYSSIVNQEQEVVEGSKALPQATSGTVEYKLPRPRKRLKQSVRNVSKDPTMSLLEDSDATNNESSKVHDRQQLHRGPRFVVDENGKIGTTEIGALSQIVSTPSANPAESIMRPLPANPVSARATRLHKPTTSIYSAKKPPASGAHSVLKARSSKLTTILRTPGVRTPLQKAGSKRSIAFEDLSKNLWASRPPASARKAGASVEAPAHGVDHITASVLKSLNRESNPVDTEKENAESSYHRIVRSRAADAEKKLVFVGIENIPGPTSQAHVVQSLAEEAISKVSSLTEKNRTFPSVTEPRKASAQGPRDRIERKQVKSTVKSALRCRIESLRAAKSASGLPKSVSGGFATSSQSSRLDGVSGETLRMEEDRTTPLINSDSLQTLPRSGAEAGRACVPNMVLSQVSPERVETETKRMLDSVNRRSGSSSARSSERVKESLRDVSPSAAQDGNVLKETEGGSRRLPDASLESAQMMIDSDDIAPPCTSGYGTEMMPHSADGKKVVRHDEIGESLTPEASEEVESEHYTSNMDPSIEASVEGSEVDTPAPNTLSNLVSSVSSFLPGASTLYGNRPEPRSAEEEAKLEATLQKQDAQRREAELIAKREAQRLARQREGQEKQRRAEERRRLLEEAAKKKEDERRRKEQLRAKKRKEDEERQRKEKQEEDRKREERRRKVLEQKRLLEKATERKEMEGKPVKDKYGKPRIGFTGGEGGTSKLKLYRPVRTKPQPLLPSAAGSSKNPGVAGHVPKTPKVGRDRRPEEISSYEMTAERKRNDSETSEEMNTRRRKKVVPQWAAKEHLLGSLKEQSTDPDGLFARVHSCDLADVFKSGEEQKKYRPRTSSGNWTKDRLTAREEVEFKRKEGFFDS